MGELIKAHNGYLISPDLHAEFPASLLGCCLAQHDDNLKLAVTLVFSDYLPLRLPLFTTTFIKHFKFYTMNF